MEGIAHAIGKNAGNLKLNSEGPICNLNCSMVVVLRRCSPCAPMEGKPQGALAQTAVSVGDLSYSVKDMAVAAAQGMIACVESGAVKMTLRLG